MVELINFIQYEKISQRDISLELISRYWVLVDHAKMIEVRIFLGCQKDTNTLEVLDLWVLGVGPWFGHRRKEPGKRQQHYLI